MKKKIIQTVIVMRFPARILAVVFTFFLLFFVVKVSYAQTATSVPQSSPPQYLNPNTDVGVPNNLHTWSQNVLLEVMSAAVCQLVGVDPVNPNQQCLGVDQQTGKIGFVQGGGGTIGVMTSMISSLYTVPIRVGDFVAYSSNSFGLIKSANAQNVTGIGYDSLTPVLTIWKNFRNIAYLLFIIVFIVIGIAIMLRVNIDARTVMTIQNQIPKLVVGIVLVTFSYAIAGFLIDIMWIGNYTVVSTITRGSASAINTNQVMNNSAQGAPGFANYIFGASPLGGILGITAGASNGIGDLIQNMFTTPLPDNTRVLNPELQPQGSQNIQAQINAANNANNPLCMTMLSPLCAVSSVLGSTVQDVMGNIVGIIVSWIVRVLAFLIIAIAVLWALLKLWFSLIKAYVFILIDVILAPFWIISGIFPKAPPSLGFGSWIRDLFANIVVFPTVIALFTFARVIMDSLRAAPVGGAAATPPFNPPLIGTVNGGGATGVQSIGPLIALGIILMSPSVAESIKKAIKASSVPTGFGGLGVGSAMVGGFVGGAYSNLMKRDQKGEAIGRGAIFLDQKIKSPIVRGLFGWNQRKPEQITETLEQRGGGTTPTKITGAQPPPPKPLEPETK